jgi:hypothetical protein
MSSWSVSSFRYEARMAVDDIISQAHHTKTEVHTFTRCQVRHVDENASRHASEDGKVQIERLTKEQDERYRKVLSNDNAAATHPVCRSDDDDIVIPVLPCRSETIHSLE